MAEVGGELDSWEDQVDSGVLDKRMEEMAIEIQNSEEKKKQHTTKSTSKQVIVSVESGQTQYQPQVRILKRDSKSSPSQTQNSGNSGASSSSKHSKTLQQREAEYAEARLRIFGSQPPSNDDEDGDGEVNNRDEAESEKSPSIAEQKPSNQGGPPQILKQDPSVPVVSLLRQPTGPDGTSGFKRADNT